MTFLFEIILAIVTAACSFIAGQLGIPLPGNVTLATVATAIVGLLSFGAGIVIKWLKSKGLKTAETILPGITSDHETAAKVTEIKTSGETP